MKNVVVGQEAVAREHALIVWRDADARARWQIGELIVTPAVDAVLMELEAAEMKAEERLTIDAARWVRA